MHSEITVPNLEGLEGTGGIVRWRYEEGAFVGKGDVVAEIESDSVLMGIRAPSDGCLESIRVAQGQRVEAGEILGLLDVSRERVRCAEAAGKDIDDGGEGAVSPAARRFALLHDVDLRRMRGSGPEGRIILSDVKKALEEKDASPREAEKLFSPMKAVGQSVRVRRLLARKMVESWETVPHFYVTVAVDMTDVIRFRKDLGVTINDFILAATAHALAEHPWVNSHFIDGEAVEHRRINISMAVATDRGLYSPVLKDCGGHSLKALSRRAARLADLAHSGRLKQSDLEEGTFTISNMGMLGVESFSALIYPPQVAALAVGTIRGEVVIDEHEELLVAPILRLTLSADHRALDGADAAEFLDTIKSYLEAPVMLISAEAEKELNP